MELQELLQALAPFQARLVAVSKTHPPEKIMALYEQGQRDFGENKVQELVDKQAQLPDDIRWHLIGHLQTNKVKYITSFTHLIHAVDSWKLLKEIDKRARQAERVMDVLLQVKIAEEDSKFGLSMQDVRQILDAGDWQQLAHVRIVGLMGMATFTDDTEQVSQEFRSLKHFFDELQQNHFQDADSFRELSMGMSGDYSLALEAGSTVVRVGSLLFGERNYS